MTPREKIDRALSDLTERGVGASASAPPMWRTAWRLGPEIPPPHFMAFGPLALLTGCVFGPLWALAMRLLVWQGQGWPFTLAAGAASGVLFGLGLALYYRRSAQRLGLTSWDRYPDV
jgi:hypothetical protein